MPTRYKSVEMTENDLKTRLGAMEARAPGPSKAPLTTMVAPGRQRNLFGSVALAPVLVLAIAATAAAGVAGILAVTGRPGAENPGQPLAGAHLECMTPPQAESYLAARGYTDVIWQVETGSLPEGVDNSGQQSSAPDRGYIVTAGFVDGNELIVVIDQRDGATPTGDCTVESTP